jgi:hypothetical protein
MKMEVSNAFEASVTIYHLHAVLCSRRHAAVISTAVRHLTLSGYAGKMLLYYELL